MDKTEVEDETPLSYLYPSIEVTSQQVKYQI